jgi:hypothetical protein
MFYYTAYNLRIASQFPLPELCPARSGGDVEVRLDSTGPVIESRQISWQDPPSATAVFEFPGAGRFTVRDGREVVVSPEPDADAPLLRLYVQGMMLAALLYQRGSFVLHASVVNVKGRAIAFTGPIGAGKSSIAAAFLAAGYGIAADDNAALDFNPTTPSVVAGFPTLKVYPAVAASLGYDQHTLELMHDSQIKRAHRVTRGFVDTALPLAGIYALDREAPEGVSLLSAIESITEVIRNSVPTRWVVRGTPLHLRMAAQLARAVPLFRIRTFSELNEIPGIVRLVSAHVLGREPDLEREAIAC